MKEKNGSLAPLYKTERFSFSRNPHTSQKSTNYQSGNLTATATHCTFWRKKAASGQLCTLRPAWEQRRPASDLTVSPARLLILLFAHSHTQAVHEDGPSHPMAISFAFPQIFLHKLYLFSFPVDVRMAI